MEWARVYFPDQWSEFHSIIETQDGGFAVTMVIDTDTTYSFYRLDTDGNMLWETAISVLAGESTQAMCEASDGGLLILTGYIPEVAHTDYQGISDWDLHTFSTGQGYGWSISSTMDGGFVVGTGSEDSYGAISRHSIDQGAQEWWDVVYDYVCTDVYCVRQLSQGGYIAAGRAHPVAGGYQAILVKYAPETGISEPDPVPSPILEIFPNPCSSLLSLKFSLEVSGMTTISIYDLSGRLIDTVADEVFPAGENTVEWVVPDDVSSGCYLIQYNSTMGSISERCVLIN